MGNQHFQQQDSKRSEYLTPKFIIDALGPFDLDPCASNPRPFDVATINYTEKDDGLALPWKGFVFLNPPYSHQQGLRKFVEKLSTHPGGGIALLNSNTQNKMWQEVLFPRASYFLFLAGRFSFLNPDGTSTGGNFGSPTLIGFGKKAATRLMKTPLIEHRMENKHG